MHIPLSQPPLQDVEGPHIALMDAKMKQSMSLLEQLKSDPPILLTRHLQYAPGALNQLGFE